MLILALLAIGIVAVALLFMSVGIVLCGRFLGEHIGQSKALRAKGIHCVRGMDAAERLRDPHLVAKTELGTRQQH